MGQAFQENYPWMHAEQQLDQFQLDTIEFLHQAGGRAVVADPMGARKTATVLRWLSDPIGLGCGGPNGPRVLRNCKKVLIIAPASVHGHWAKEAARWARCFDVFVGRGSKPQREATRSKLADAELGLYITTYESAKLDQYELERFGFDTVVFDEGHKLKGRRTQVALMANAFAKFPMCVIITGTPVMNHAAELWQYLHMLRPKQFRSFWSWALDNFKIEERRFKGNRFPTRIIHDWKTGALERVREQTADYFIQRDIKDLFPDAPWIEEPEHVELSVELSPAERKAYDQLVKHNWTEIEGRQIVTGGSLDLTTRLNQLISSWAALGGSETGAKMRAAIELIRNLLERDEKVLVLVKYKETLHQLHAVLHDCAAVYHGDMNQTLRDGMLEDFLAAGDNSSQVMIGTLDSLSEGVDGMQYVCSNIVMVDRHWVPAKNDQAIGRLRRSGQTKRVTVYHVFAEDTIDATITEACIKKQNAVELLTGRPLSKSLYGG